MWFSPEIHLGSLLPLPVCLKGPCGLPLSLSPRSFCQVTISSPIYFGWPIPKDASFFWWPLRSPFDTYQTRKECRWWGQWHLGRQWSRILSCLRWSSWGCSSRLSLTKLCSGWPEYIFMYIRTRSPEEGIIKLVNFEGLSKLVCVENSQRPNSIGAPQRMSQPMVQPIVLLFPLLILLPNLFQMRRVYRFIALGIDIVDIGSTSDEIIADCFLHINTTAWTLWIPACALILGIYAIVHEPSRV